MRGFLATRIRSLVKARLEEEGHEGIVLDSLTDQIANAALERLVFLVGVEADQVGFEIRSFQEFMAAECLMDGSDSTSGTSAQGNCSSSNLEKCLPFCRG